jgi:hypothetical protein
MTFYADVTLLHVFSSISIGGWLHLEPFIAPSFFEEFADVRIPLLHR